MRVLSRVVAVALFGLVAIAVVLVGPLDGAGVERAPLPPGAAGEAAARVMPSVVDIRAQGGGVERGRIAIGTGVIVDQSGLIVTNDHVVTGESDQAAAAIEVILSDERRSPGHAARPRARPRHRAHRGRREWPAAGAVHERHGGDRR